MEGQRTQSRDRRTSTVNQPNGTQNSNILNFGTQGAKAVTGWINSHRWMTVILLLLLIFFLPLPWSCEREERTPDSTSLAPSAPPAVIPPVIDRPAEAEPTGTIIGGSKVVVSNVSPTVVEDWMLQNMAGQTQGWELLKLVHEGTITRYGTYLLPISPACFPRGEIQCTLQRFGGGHGYLWNAVIVRQGGKSIVRMSDRAQVIAITPEMGSVFVGCQDRTPYRGVGQENVAPFDYRIEIHPGPNVGLWVGSQKRMMDYPSLATPGLLPLRLAGSDSKEESVGWVMHLTMLPYEQVIPGEDIVKDTISPPGFYQLYGYQLFLLPSDAPVIDEMAAYDEKVAVIKNAAVFTKVLRPSPQERESLKRDSFQVSSEEVRETWRLNSIKEPAYVRVYLEVRTPTVARWEVTFPLAGNKE